MFKKIISGNNRKTRFHDEKGNFIGVSKFIKHSPKAFGTGLLRLTVGYRPELPWIAYDMIAYLDSFLSKNSRVLEFGSGMSTLWYAKKAGEVYSIEDYRIWYDKIISKIKESEIKNIHYIFEASTEEYSKFMFDDQQGFDLIMVDGSHRSSCIVNSVQKLRPGGILYLDNSDKHSTSAGGDTRIAEEFLLDFANRKNAEVIYFTDFAPTQFFVQQGLMVRLPNS